MYESACVYERVHVFICVLVGVLFMVCSLECKSTDQFH